MDYSKIASYLLRKGANAVNPSAPQETDLGDLAVDIGGSFVPGVGQAMALRDFNRAREEGDPLGMGLSALGAIPGVGGAMKVGKKIFGGLKGAAGDAEKLAALKKAEELRAAGKGKGEVWEKAGWTETVEPGKPMFEIADDVATFSTKAGFNHPELFKRYPELKDVKIKRGKLGEGAVGEYDAAKKTITIDPSLSDAQVRDILLHEFQHGVDKIEGRIWGSNATESKDLADQLRSAVRVDATLDAAHQAKGLMAQGAAPKEAMDFVTENAGKPLNDQMLKRFTMAAPDDLMAERQLAKSQLDALIRDNVTMHQRKNYLGNAGEVRARAVQARKDLDPVALRTTHPEHTMEYIMDDPIKVANILRR